MIFPATSLALWKSHGVRPLGGEWRKSWLSHCDPNLSGSSYDSFYGETPVEMSSTRLSSDRAGAMKPCPTRPYRCDVFLADLWLSQLSEVAVRIRPFLPRESPRHFLMSLSCVRKGQRQIVTALWRMRAAFHELFLGAKWKCAETQGSQLAISVSSLRS